jgi:hypothetical protein
MIVRQCSHFRRLLVIVLMSVTYTKQCSMLVYGFCETSLLMNVKKYSEKVGQGCPCSFDPVKECNRHVTMDQVVMQ